MNRKQRRKMQSRAKRAGATSPSADTPQERGRLNEAIAHHQAGRLENADVIYQELLRADPRNPDMLHLSGVVALQTGRHENALDLIGRAIAENSGIALYHRNMALTLEALDRAGDALSHFAKAAELAPAETENHLRLAHAFDRAGRPADAAVSFRRAIETEPRDAEIHTSLAVTLINLGDMKCAGDQFALALECAPGAAFAHANLGRFHADKNEPETAEPLLRRALEIDPDFDEALIELGALLNAAHCGGEALPLLEKARALRPDSVKARSEHAAALELTGHPERARDEIAAIIKDHPEDDRAHNNLGLILSRLDQFGDAILAYDKALELNPDYDDAYSNRSLLRLAQGDFAGGWEDYLHRDTIGEIVNVLDRGTLPEDLSGKRIALYRDQGLGDEIFFLRFAGELKRRGATIAYNPDPKIAAMIERLDFIDNIIRGDWPAEGHDLRFSLGDLPYLLSITEVANIPPPLEIPVLPGRDHEITEFLRGVGPPPYIGITWRAGVQYRDRLSKMSPQTTLAEVLKPLNGTVLILQRKPRDNEIADISGLLGDRLHDASHYNDDLEGMLALLGRIDEYACVSNTNTHLRAARGRRSRVLIPLPPDYRWMESGDESPWFPGTPLYRETTETGWIAAFEILGRDLSKAVGLR
jgi:tetratricopeptide (TPR) repeat protein